MKLKTTSSLIAGASLALISQVAGQSVYSADWTTLAGSDGRFTVSMTLESGAAIGGVKAYDLQIGNDNGRNYFANGKSTITSGPYTADVAQETNTFTVSAGLFSGAAVIRSSDVINFTNVTGIEGQLLNPTGTATSSFPISLSETDSTSLSWKSSNFGFDTLRTDPDGPKGTNIWDEYTYELSQTWTVAPEPSSAMLLGFAGLSLVVRRRR